MREWEKRESVPLVFATPIDYFRELDKMRSTLPRVKGIVDPVGWPFWYGSCGSQGSTTGANATPETWSRPRFSQFLERWREHRIRQIQIESLWRDKLTLDPHDGLYVGDADVVDLIHLASRRIRMPAVAQSGHRENQPGHCRRSRTAGAGVFQSHELAAARESSKSMRSS
jgi:hypothetical protein